MIHLTQTRTEHHIMLIGGGQSWRVLVLHVNSTGQECGKVLRDRACDGGV